jgi:hypothetical protein
LERQKQHAVHCHQPAHVRATTSVIQSLAFNIDFTHVDSLVCSDFGSMQPVTLHGDCPAAAVATRQGAAHLSANSATAQHLAPITTSSTSCMQKDAASDLPNSCDSNRAN